MRLFMKISLLEMPFTLILGSYEFFSEQFLSRTAYNMGLLTETDFTIECYLELPQIYRPMIFQNFRGTE